MSFMYNPFPYDDPRPVNRPGLRESTVRSLVKGGTVKAAAALASEISGRGRTVIAFDGYTTADFAAIVNLLQQQLHLRGLNAKAFDFSVCYKSEKELYDMIDSKLTWDRSIDPTLLFGYIYKGGYEGMLDREKVSALRKSILCDTDVVIVYGLGCLVPSMRDCYDIKCYLDVTPKETMLRIRRGHYVNLGMSAPLTTPLIIRRCYYCDFEVAVGLRKELLRGDVCDYYFESDHVDDMKMLPREALKDVFESLAKYPFRCKPVYLEGVWGGSYFTRMRNLPKTMRNCAWVFDLIPMEVSIMVEIGETVVEFPFCSFFMKEGDAVLGPAAVKKFDGYFPIRFNWDDSWHSSGNMSIQCHSGADFNRSRYNEFGRQDESYYVVAAGHGAKTFLGFRDDADTEEFFKAIEAADTKGQPVDYQKYVSYEESKPGLQVMIPAGTVHSSGRNQVVLEIGSLTIGSYTYKMYDYLRLDFDGKQRPIHTRLGKENVVTSRTTSWVRNNIVQAPRKIREGEYIIGEHDLLYFSLRRLEFEKSIEDDTAGRFHVLTLVDGDKVRVRSKACPERCYEAGYLDIVVVPADMGEYVIENIGVEPICIHKTLLKDGFENDFQ